MGKGGGGGGPTQTTSTVQNTNIPQYAQPYVESMLGATQKQLFNTKEIGGTPAVAATYDDQGNQLTAGSEAVPGYTSIEGFKPYQAYGGTYDQNKTLPDGTPNPNYGNQLSYDASKAIAGFQPMQTAAQQGIAGMQLPADQYRMAQLGAEAAGRGGLSSAQQALGYGAQGAAAGQAGQAFGLQSAANTQALANKQAGLANMYGAQGAAIGQQGQQLGLQGGQLGITGGAQYGAQGAGYGAQGAGLASPALGYGSTGAGYGAQAAQLANTALGYGQGSADIGQMALRAQGMGEGIAGQSQALARQQAGAGAQYAQMATDPRVTQALMNPYTQNVLDVQNRELNRQADIAGNVRGAQAARAGAFGGSRQAIENSEANRNLAMMKNANQAQALNQAFQNAQAQQQFGANLNLQGLSSAQQGLGTALQGGQLGLSGLGTALQGQQGALAGVGQAGAMYGLGMQGAQTGLQGVNAANQAYQTGIQGSGMGLQGVNTQLAGVDRQLAGTSQGMQGAGMGLQGVGAATNAGQLGVQGAQLGLQGTAQGMQGAQAGMQGVQGAQAGYGLANQAAGNLTNMLGQEQQNQLGIYGAQNAAGAQQQALEQAKINQSMQDYANAQQYPLMQLGTMSNMLRGLPMQASTTNQYAASPNPLSQAVGTIGAGASMYNAMAPRGAAGGEVKGYAKGGIMSYDMGGEVESQLESMDEKGLAAQARESSSPTIRKMAQRMLRERQMSKQPQSPDAANVQYQAAQPQMPSYAPGGIVAFAAGDRVYGGPSSEEGNEENSRIGMEERLAKPAPTTGGIMGAAPVTQIPTAPAGPSPDVVQEAMRQRNLASAQATRPTADVLKDIQAEREALGVGENVGRQEFRAQQMAERANMKDEQERQRSMRLAEFFASWGSTPGPVLVAGMNALKQSIPNLISDEKEAKKARKEADKIIYDIDEATRLEKLGMIDKATALKEKAAQNAEDYNKSLLSYQAHKESAAASVRGHELSKEGQIESALIRAQQDKLNRGQAELHKDEDRKFGQYQAAAKQYDSIKEFVTKQESSDIHKDDLKKLERYTMGAKDKKTGEVDESKINKEYKTPYAETKKRVEERIKTWNTAVEEAAKERELAYSRVKGLSNEAKEARAKPKGTPTVSLDDPSLQRQ